MAIAEPVPVVPDMTATLRLFAAVHADRGDPARALAGHVARELEEGRSLFDIVMDPEVQARLDDEGRLA